MTKETFLQHYHEVELRYFEGTSEQLHQHTLTASELYDLLEDRLPLFELDADWSVQLGLIYVEAKSLLEKQAHQENRIVDYFYLLRNMQKEEHHA